MPTPDPIDLLRRLSANRGAGVPMPAALARDVLTWLADAAPAILAGEPADVALGLRVRPGARSLARAYRQSRRDAGIAAAFSLATGSDERRAETVLHWWDQFTADRPVPAPVVEALRMVADSGVPMPTDARTVARARTRAGRAPAVLRDDDCGTLDPEARPTAAHGTRT
jgi:hypothetical protein